MHHILHAPLIQVQLSVVPVNKQSRLPQAWGSLPRAAVGFVRRPASIGYRDASAAKPEPETPRQSWLGSLGPAAGQPQKQRDSETAHTPRESGTSNTRVAATQPCDSARRRRPVPVRSPAPHPREQFGSDSTSPWLTRNCNRRNRPSATG
jgi:hypothetical protein